jgi:hypothetical protein
MLHEAQNRRRIRDFGHCRNEVGDRRLGHHRLPHDGEGASKQPVQREEDEGQSQGQIEELFLWVPPVYISHVRFVGGT